MVPGWFGLLFFLGDLLRHQLYAVVLESYQFDSEIVCIVGNRHTGNIYVQTKDNLTMLDSGLKIVGKQCPLDTGYSGHLNPSNSSRTDRENATCNDLLKTFRPNCTASEGFEPMHSASGTVYHASKTNPSCTDGKTICVFPANHDRYFLIVTKNQTTELWQRTGHGLHNGSCTFFRTLRCELPEEVFPEASAGLFIKDSNVSGSLFLAFTNTNNAAERVVKMTVTCEYRINLTDPVNDQTWTKPTASKALPLHPRALLHLEFSSRKALLLVEPHDVIMQWLPIAERSSTQSILPNNFEPRNHRLMNVVDVVIKENTTEVYVATDSMVMLIDLDNCSPRPTCSQCIQSGESFCGWCFSEKRCMYRQLCPSDNKTQPESWWLNSSKSDLSEEQCHTHSTTAKSFQAKKATSRPKTLKSDNKGTKSLVPVSRMALWNAPLSTIRPMDLAAAQAAKMVIWVSLLLAVILSGMITVVVISYRRVRSGNIQTVNRVKHRFPECEGIRSYRKLRSICLLLGGPAAVQYRYRRQMQHSGDTEESTDSPLVT